MPLKIEQIAEIAHEANRAYCKVLGDFSQKSWDDAPKWQKNSIIEGVKVIFKDPDTSPEKQHNEWMEYKIADGWKYGVSKNSDTKTHPCIVPYDELPIEQKIKDYLRTSIVTCLKTWSNE
jgi:hypothetical protein